MKIALGTVQWGMNYGISNLNGVPNDDELNKIFRRMKDVGIDTLDTAISYGTHKRDFENSFHPHIKLFQK